ncbi:formimidoylglutamate deiminase [Variovorax sp. Root473]|uniref:formimidoylglutamate deiminase n=1 Tax=Variovorax sp. Root473 TaxID=1736541 RepID=UPI0007009BDB|nr:formimidoylglutamate deiminase [Variovorax sp. Root473]KQX84307.1 N-formimino-L-glutamate deiminase [Variovorax sp. Root473]
MTHTLFAADALLPEGWTRNVLLTWNDAGQLTQVQAGAQRPADAQAAQGPVIPGMPNLHSHAFQRAFAGLTEHRAEPEKATGRPELSRPPRGEVPTLSAPGGVADSFWSWRTLMYRFAARLGPQHMEAIATWLYAEMLEAGYTSVCEFQYVHHDTDGRPYTDDAALSRALLRAAQATGIGFTLLPVLYQTSGFGDQPPTEGQRRFIRSTESMLRLLETLKPDCDAQGARLGLAPHSLRAVPPDALHEALAGLDAIDRTAPVHIHIAEQTKEVDDCVEWSGLRPVEWLLDHARVDARWCLVHATHMNDAEYEYAARSGAVAGLCPTTEANLGDGIFDFAKWRSHGGAWGVGSDSHASVNAAEELLMLEYSQRLAKRQRNVGASAAQPHVATALTLEAVQGGAQASARAVGGLAAGQQADFVVLDAAHVALQGLSAPDMLSAHVFASHRTSAVDAVWVAGRARVAAGRHVLHDEAVSAFVAARTRLLQD